MRFITLRKNDLHTRQIICLIWALVKHIAALPYKSSLATTLLWRNNIFILKKMLIFVLFVLSISFFHRDGAFGASLFMEETDPYNMISHNLERTLAGSWPSPLGLWSPDYQLFYNYIPNRFPLSLRIFETRWEHFLVWRKTWNIKKVLKNI